MAKVKSAPPAPLESIEDARVRQELDDLCKQYRAVSEEVAAADTLKKILMEDIKRIGFQQGLKKVAGEGYQLVRSGSSSTTISKDKLVDKGVSLDLIADCTVKNSWEYFQVLEYVPEDTE